MGQISSSKSKPATKFAVPTNSWDDAKASNLSESELLLYRSNLLGSDLTVTNFGGGNTSAKLTETENRTAVRNPHREIGHIETIEGKPINRPL